MHTASKRQRSISAAGSAGKRSSGPPPLKTPRSTHCITATGEVRKTGEQPLRGLEEIALESVPPEILNRLGSSRTIAFYRENANEEENTIWAEFNRSKFGDPETNPGWQSLGAGVQQEGTSTLPSFDDVVALGKTCPWGIRFYTEVPDDPQGKGKITAQQWYEWYDLLRTGLEVEEMKARDDSISTETGEVGSYFMTKVLRSGHFGDHGVVMCNNLEERDKIVQLTPRVSRDGIGGLQVKAFPVTDQEGKPLDGGIRPNSK